MTKRTIMRTITMHVTFGTAITFDCPDNVQACTHYKPGASIAYVRILMRRGPNAVRSLCH